MKLPRIPECQKERFTSGCKEGKQNFGNYLERKEACKMDDKIYDLLNDVKMNDELYHVEELSEIEKAEIKAEFH